ncbi:hypothetical protein WJX72_007200 [[Myrmecia] bisecta]|uniref:NADH dehydrogenase [ubiquinone] 1 alpha subcomplex subunit 6 n=1 Tax=[Myrmecia] bisecta TaxID=41462 RepID=A0AAW1PKC5_9CHLO
MVAVTRFLARAAQAEPISKLATPVSKLELPTSVKTKDFFRECMRVLPWAVKNYKLEELTSVPELRSTISALFKQHSSIENPQVVDILIYKGREELEMVMLQHKQRHHLIADYIRVPAAVKREAEKRSESDLSPFLEQFYLNKR